MDNPKTSSRFKTFTTEHKSIFFALIGVVVIIILVFVILLTNPSDNDGIEGDDSRDYDSSLAADQRALSNTEVFKISDYLPIISADPSYQISYVLDNNEKGDYTFHLTLYALSASGRTAMINRLLSEDFGSYDPLNYDIELLNYYNPFINYSLEDLKAGHLPPNITNANLYHLDDTPYSVRTLTHALYDGSTNTYRYILENDEPKSMPQLLFTYADLPYIHSETVRYINTLE